MSESDLYDTKLSSPPPQLVSEVEAHGKLKRNLTKALDLHDRIMDGALPPEWPAGDRRLALEAANTTVKAALTTDRTALKAREGNTLERVFLRVLFHRKRLGQELSSADRNRLATATRAELDAALGPRELEEYDRMEF